MNNNNIAHARVKLGIIINWEGFVLRTSYNMNRKVFLIMWTATILNYGGALTEDSSCAGLSIAGAAEPLPGK